MDRRDILKSAAILSFMGAASFTNAEAKSSARPKTIKPKRLKAGDTVAVIAPSSGASAEAFERALANVAMLGLKAKKT